METTVEEIADRVFRISTFVPDITPEGFTFNQFLLRAEQPLLFHTGMRRMFRGTCEAIERILPVQELRWIGFGHIEADECGAMNDFLAAAPLAEVAHGALGVDVSLNDLCDRAPRALADGEVLNLGDMRVRHVDTPHVPHAWDARVLFEESTGTLLCGDLFAHTGNPPASTPEDIVGPAIAAEKIFRATCLTPETAPTIRALAELQPNTLATMHGSSFHGDCQHSLRDLADFYARELADRLG